ncbi:MAG TPA: ATP-binding cassette domain-containing protein [Terriglobales bacterium]|nr:ATP-binding cassette domain-containing protein [Terriglobales bacterium]
MPTASDPFFEFRNVFKGFAMRAVLEDVTFEVARGESLCIVGRSGVGKSVTLKLIMGFLRPDRGAVCVEGTNLATLSDAELTAMHRKVTLVFQSGALFDSLTVGENVAFPLRERGLEGKPCTEEQIEVAVNELLGLLELQAERDLFPASLSTGMKRAVAIARALAAHPQAILYDEPTTMVDPIMAHSIAQLILRVKRQVKLTSVIVTHDTRLARMLADRLVLLHEGRVRFFGTIAEMDASQDPVLREFLRQDEMAVL